MKHVAVITPVVLWDWSAAVLKQMLLLVDASPSDCSHLKPVSVLSKATTRVKDSRCSSFSFSLEREGMRLHHFIDHSHLRLRLRLSH